MARQGPHHPAQKSTIHTPSAAASASSNVCSVRCTTPFSGPECPWELMEVLLLPLRCPWPKKGCAVFSGACGPQDLGPDPAGVERQLRDGCVPAAEGVADGIRDGAAQARDRKSTRLNSSHLGISY